MLGLPLRILEHTQFRPYVTLQNIDELKATQSFLVGTSTSQFLSEVAYFPR